MWVFSAAGAVRVSRQKFALEAAIDSHASCGVKLLHALPN
jgi:hypothetical protein